MKCNNIKHFRAALLVDVRKNLLTNLLIDSVYELLYFLH